MLIPNLSAVLPTPDSQQQPTWPRLAEVLLILLMFFAPAGDPAPYQNEPYYLCRLKHAWNPAWCLGDFYLESPDAHFTFVYTFGWLTKWLTLAATAWAGRIFVWSLLAWAWQRLSWLIVLRPYYSVLSAVPLGRADRPGKPRRRMGRRWLRIQMRRVHLRSTTHFTNCA